MKKLAVLAALAALAAAVATLGLLSGGQVVSANPPGVVCTGDPQDPGIHGIKVIGADGSDIDCAASMRGVHIFGGSGGVEIIGTDFDDQIEGGAGNDMIDGSGGYDYIDGGPGMDTLDGGAGDDWIEGGPGLDTFDGGAGDYDYCVGDGDDPTPQQGNFVGCEITIILY